MACNCNKRKVVSVIIEDTLNNTTTIKKGNDLKTNNGSIIQSVTTYAQSVPNQIPTTNGVNTANTDKTTITQYVFKAGTSVAEASSIDLESCYECTKKHISRAMIFFEEYHTGYPDHLKNLTDSLSVAEDAVKRAYIDRISVMAHLDMASGELLGNDIQKSTMSKEHIEIANKIREERLKLGNNPLYKPDFKELLISVELLKEKYMNATSIING